MAARVAHDRVRRVEPHRLRVQQRSCELRGVVVLDPRARVHEVGEAHRVALGEAEVGEGLELVGDLLGHRPGDAVLRHAVHQPGPHQRHPLVGALGAHGLAELVGLAGGEVGHVDGHLHELLLEQRHAEGLLEASLEERVEVGDRLLAPPAADVGMDGAALDRAGPDEGHLDDDVVERPRPQPREGGHLGPALDLEHADGVGGAEEVVDRPLLRDGGQVDLDAPVFGDEVDGQVEHRQHPEAEEVELHQAGRGAVVLVPLEDGPVLHGRPLGRAVLDEGPIGDDHAPGVDPEMAGEALHLAGQVEHQRRDAGPAFGPGCGEVTAGVVLRFPHRPALDRLGHGVGLAR